MEYNLGSKDAEENVGVLGPSVENLPVDSNGRPTFELRRGLQADSPMSPERKEMLSRMAANMIIEEKPRGNYFVREPGL